MPTKHLQPIEEEFGGQHEEGQHDGEASDKGHDGTELEEMAGKYEQLKTQMEQYFDDNNGKGLAAALVHLTVDRGNSGFLQGNGMVGVI